MKNKQPFEVVELSETYVVGLPLRTSNETEQQLMDQGWIATTWVEVREIEHLNPPAAAYTGYAGDKDDTYSMVIGSECNSLEDAEAGEVITKIPAGTYAKFTNTGSIPDAVFEAWQTIWQAEEEGDLNRAYTTDLERYIPENEDSMRVELYIAIK